MHISFPHLMIRLTEDYHSFVLDNPTLKTRIHRNPTSSVA